MYQLRYVQRLVFFYAVASFAIGELILKNIFICLFNERNQLKL